ncbi:MAG: magnesium chelatase, partial [Candidatus Portnoybacteria bacterium CG_4_9_14_3_um_filter_40_10]
GLDSKLVEVETDLKDGFPRFDILGLGDKAIEEAKGRVRSAIINSNFSFPARKKIIVNLAPADIKKEGTSYDLPLAVGILLSSEQIDPVLIKEKTLFVGELSLEGKLRHTKGILPMAILAKKLGIKNIFLP